MRLLFAGAFALLCSVGFAEDPALLAAIQARPDDDTPRLVFADWLDDQSTAEARERAEFIRLQVDLARMDPYDPRVIAWRARANQLLIRNRQQWEPADLPQGASVRFERGFPAELKVRFPLRDAREVHRLLERFPTIQALDLQHDPRFDFAALTGTPEAARLKHFTLAAESRGMPSELGAFLDSCRSLTSLDLQSPALLNPTQQVSERFWRQLTSYRGKGAHLPADLAAATNLNKLYLSGLDGPQPAIALLRDHLTAVRHFGCENCNLFDEHLTELLRTRVAGQLESLSLAGNVLSGRGIVRLARDASEHLRMLDLSWQFGMRDPAARWLAASQRLRSLRELRLNGADFTERGFQALAESYYLSGLTHLELRNSGLTNAGLLALARSPELTRLIALDVAENHGLSPDIAGTPLARRVQSLTLSTGAQSELAEMLRAGVPALVRLALGKSPSFAVTRALYQGAAPALAELTFAHYYRARGAAILERRAHYDCRFKTLAP